jgi:hypothetical protein
MITTKERIMATKTQVNDLIKLIGSAGRATFGNTCSIKVANKNGLVVKILLTFVENGVRTTRATHLNLGADNDAPKQLAARAFRELKLNRTYLRVNGR